MTRRAGVVRLVGWTAAVGVALLGLAATGHGALAAPPVGSPGRWSAWFEQRDPAAAAFALLRLVAVGGCWYLAGTTVVGSLLRLARADVLVAVADRVTIAPVRHLLAGALTLTLVGIGPAGAQTPRPSTTTSTSIPTPATSTTSTTSLSAPATVLMQRLPPVGAEPTPPPVAAAPTPDRYTVQPGDCFWTIADDLLHQAWGRAPTDGEIVPYWLRLIDANRAELADPGNADLIFPAQVFTVPPLPPPGGTT